MLGAGVQVLVDENAYEEAVDILQLDKKINEEVLCPHCNSGNVKFGLGTKKGNKILTVVLSVFSGIPFGNIKNTFYCLDCMEDFKV